MHAVFHHFARADELEINFGAVKTPPSVSICDNFMEKLFNPFHLWRFHTITAWKVGQRPASHTLFHSSVIFLKKGSKGQVNFCLSNSVLLHFGRVNENFFASFVSVFQQAFETVQIIQGSHPDMEFNKFSPELYWRWQMCVTELNNRNPWISRISSKLPAVPGNTVEFLLSNDAAAKNAFEYLNCQ